MTSSEEKKTKMDTSPPASQEKEKNCAFCKEPTERTCAGCQNVYYCNREHQKAHWKVHVNECSVLKLVEEPSGQKYYVATRNIKVGQLIHQEKEPIVIGPDIRMPIFPQCLGCYNQLKKETAKPCKICGWPLCLNCTKHGAECEFTVKFLKRKMNITRYDVTSVLYPFVLTSANTLTEDPDIRIIRISESEASDPYYPDIRIIRIIRISELSGYPYYSDIRIIKIFELSGYPDPDICLLRNYGLYIGLYKWYI